MKRQTIAMRGWALLLILLLAVPASPVTRTAAPELPNPGSTGMTRAQQEQLGLKAAAEIYKQSPVLPDSSPITQYVQQLGSRLATVIPQNYSWPYQFHVIQQSDINAFALPGGPIFVNLGTINAAENEAQLAGVLAHEMSHIYMQHSAKQAPKQQWAGILGALGGLLGGSAIGDLAQMGIQFSAGSLLMKYSRKDEAQADAVGALIMYKAGYDPRALAAFFQKLEESAGNGGPQFLSDHPNPGNRVQAVEKEIANWPPKTYMPTSSDFLRAKQAAKGIQTYTAQQIADGAKTGAWAAQNQKSGAVPQATSPDAPAPPPQNTSGTLTNVAYDRIKPSDNLSTYSGGDFAISYPANWQIFTGQSSLTIAPAAGVAQDSVAYGVILSRITPKSLASVDDATQALIESLQASNPDLQIFNSARLIVVAGTEGRSVDLAGSSPVQRNGRALEERDWLVIVPQSSGALLYLVFIAPANDFPQLQPTYQKMLDSLKVK